VGHESHHLSTSADENTIRPVICDKAAGCLRHQFNTNSSYQLPFGNGKKFGTNATGFMDKLIANWQLNGILNIQSGFPMTPVVGINQNLDMSLFKRIPSKERLNLQFWAEAFNILNHLNFNSPISGNVVFDTGDSSKYAGSAGTITETANRERQIQFALRLEF
jgi:hypothetical protein